MKNMSYQTRVLIKKIAFSVFVVLVTLTLSHMPVYGVNKDFFKVYFQNGSILKYNDILTGGALSQLAVGGFGVTSLIMAGIIIQLLGVLFPKIEKIHQDGEIGRRLFDRITMIISLIMTVSISCIVLYNMKDSPYYTGIRGIGFLIPIFEWFFGTFIIVFLAQKVQEKGIGNGPTLILAANIVSRIPEEFLTREYDDVSKTMIVLVGILLFVTILVAVYLQEGRINIPVQQTRKQLSIMNAEGYIPVPLAMSNVLPIIYAMSIMMMPSVIVTIFHKKDGFWVKCLDYTNQANWYSFASYKGIIGLIIYLLMIAMFSMYASRLTFSTPEIANRMRENGDVIPSVAPGKDTEIYLEKRRKKLARCSIIFLLVVAVVPDFILTKAGIRGFSFMGTSLIILMASFWDLRLRFTAMTKHLSKKYELFSEVK